MKHVSSFWNNVVGAGVLLGVVTMAAAAPADGKSAKPKPYPLQTCVVSGEKFGGDMGKPHVFTYQEREIKLCCKSCLKDFRKEPAKFIKKLEETEKAKMNSAPSKGHDGHGGTTASTPAMTRVPKLALNGVAKAAFENYLAAQASLAGDSLETVSTSASTLARAVRADTGKTFPAEVASEAEALAKAKDLVAARKAFRSLSESLIRYTKAGSIPPGTLYEVYCPMAKASWLQADKTVRNPYFGQAMLRCGQIRG